MPAAKKSTPPLSSSAKSSSAKSNEGSSERTLKRQSSSTAKPVTPITTAPEAKAPEVRHQSTCQLCQRAGLDNALDEAHSSCHATKVVCACMNGFVMDKTMAMEFQTLERNIDAYEIVQTMREVHGDSLIDSDYELMEIEYRYSQVMELYGMLSEVGTAKAAHRNSWFRRHSTSKPVVARKGSMRSDIKAVLEKARARQHARRRLEERTKKSGVKSPHHEPLTMKASLHSQPSELQASEPLEWHTAVAEGEKCQIWYRQYADSPLITFRMEGEVDASVLSVLSVLAEIDLFTTWIPYFKFPLK
eukprot:GHVU01050221.1.p1 GENE.GHVU01050221.1~~GHVU01050221.1.p1  ORF type:complete len:303 (-),score=33.57 GHVU01050221.1:815-1723(-)